MGMALAHQTPPGLRESLVAPGGVGVWSSGLWCFELDVSDVTSTSADGTTVGYCSDGYCDISSILSFF